jgi:hypothetical protein
MIKTISPMSSMDFYCGKTLQLIKEELPDEFDRIVVNVCDTPKFQKFFPGYQHPMAKDALSRLT